MNHFHCGGHRRIMRASWKVDRWVDRTKRSLFKATGILDLIGDTGRTETSGMENELE